MYLRQKLPIREIARRTGLSRKQRRTLKQLHADLVALGFTGSYGRFGRLIDQNIAQAQYLAALVEAHPRLALAAPQVIDIVCFRYDSGGLDEAARKAVNVEIMLRLQESGAAVLSDTSLNGRHALRVAICNHRTRRDDLDLLVREVVRIGDEVTSGA
jgi:glutamate/tyrosine decarboxylase-like PLP-dependent enzyme